MNDPEYKQDVTNLHILQRNGSTKNLSTPSSNSTMLPRISTASKAAFENPYDSRNISPEGPTNH